jgi:serine/threonine protein kinase
MVDSITLKPNILMNDDHKAVLTDFGISSITDQNMKSIMTTLQRGNVRWNSPELIFEDTAEPTCGSDIWGFGMVAVELLTKGIPFQNIVSDGAVILHIHKGNRPVRPDGVDESLWNLIDKCWHDTPNQRISAIELESELRKLLQTRNALQRANKVQLPPANLRNRGVGKFAGVDFAVIRIVCFPLLHLNFFQCFPLVFPPETTRVH